jgi:DinB superfamily
MSEPQQPTPDAKDWTWVLDRPCPECGFDARAVEHEDVAELTLDYAAALSDVVRGPRATLRPAPDVWSPTEYACHVRDVCALFVGRLNRMLAEDDPVFDNWDQDATAIADEYWRQRPGLVIGQLTAAADVIAEQFAAVRDEQWARPGRRSNGSAFTVDSFARYFLHDLAHHLWDVRG